jgi:hypothetical protein
MKLKNAMGLRNENNEKSPKAPSTFDTGARLLLFIIRKACALVGDKARIGEYLVQNGRSVKLTLFVLKRLGLAEETDSSFGWKPTDLLIQILVQRAIRRRKPSASDASPFDRAIEHFLLNTAVAEIGGAHVFPANVLGGLGLLRSDEEGELKATRALCELLTGENSEMEELLIFD